MDLSLERFLGLGAIFISMSILQRQYYFQPAAKKMVSAAFTAPKIIPA